MDVKAHKQRAQALEKKGETAKARAAYREILDHLEGSKGLLRELPMFVKVGDLCRKEDDKKTALAMYDRAGQLYAEYGSGKSVIAICMKILKVLPEATNTHVHYARLLVEGEHIAEARMVLINYAQLFDLPKVQRALEAMEGRSKSEMTPMLEMVLEMADLGMPEAESESDAELVEIAELDAEPEEEAVPDMDEAMAAGAKVAQPTKADAEGKDEDGFEISKGMTDVLDERPVARKSIITGDIASEIDESKGAKSEGTKESDSDSFVVKSGEDWEIEESSVVEGGEKGPAIATPEIPAADAPPPTAAAAPSDVPNLDLGPPAADKVETMEGLVSLGDDRSGDLRVDRFSDNPMSPPRPSASRPRPSSASPSRASAAHGRPSAAHGRASAAHGRPSAAHGRPSAPHRSPRRGPPKRKNRISGFQALMGVAFAVALGFALTKFVPVASIGSGSEDAPAVGSASQGNATPAPARPAPVQPTDTASVAIIPFDSILDSIDVDPGVDGLPSLAAIDLDSTVVAVGADSAPPRVPLIRVEGLVVATVRALITPGRTGLRVIQILESGERLTLTIFPLSEDAARDLVDGEVHAANITESIVQGIVRFGDYEVRARATVSSDLLEALLQQLVEGSPTS